MNNKKLDFNMIKTWVWCTKQIHKMDKRFVLFSSLISLITGIYSPVSLLITQRIINLLQLRQSLNKMIFLIFLYIGLDILYSLILNFYTLYKTNFSLRFNLSVNESILQKAASLSLKDYEDSETYNTINRAQAESEGKILSFFETNMTIFTHIVSLLSYLLILIKFNFWLVILIIIIPIFKFYFIKKINNEAFELAISRTSETRKAWYIQYIITYGNFFKELRLNGLFDYFIKRYKEFNKKFNNQDINIQKKQTKLLSITSFLENVIDGSLLFCVVLSGYNREILIGSVMTYLNTISQIKDQLTQIIQILSQLNENTLFINLLIEYLTLDEEIENEQDNIEINSIDSIKISHLSYKYGVDDYALKNINLEINKGDLIAIVGENGSGKSTLAKILMGFYPDYEGEIFVNGIELCKINKQSLQQRIGAIFQDFIEFEGTFRENIGYGNLDVINHDQSIMNLINKFDLSTLINKSQKLLETQIGNWFDNGKQISKGQWQKVALARMFAKSADLFILDEPNSALDSISESKILKSNLELLTGKTGIIISHKFTNFIQKTDKIVVLSKGEILGKGNHQDLIVKCKTYKNLYEKQTSIDEK